MKRIIVPVMLAGLLFSGAAAAQQRPQCFNPPPIFNPPNPGLI